MQIPQSLQVMPDIARQIIDTFADEWITTQQVVKIVNQDPAISARLVGLANSAYFSVADEITTVEGAITRVLGLDLTRGVAIGMSCKTQLDDVDCQGFDTKRFWTSALTISQATSSIQRNADRSQAALCGMLWHVGMLLAVAVDPKRCAQIFTQTQNPPFQEIEQAFGQSVYELGSTLLQAWQLPPTIFETHQHLHAAQRTSSFPEHDTAAAIWLARALAKQDSGELMALPDIRKQLESRALVESVEATDVQALRQVMSASL